MKTRVEVLKKNYGFSKLDYKYIPAGSEILKYIGQEVVFIHYQKEGENNWTTKSEKAIIVSIEDYDPMTMTYNCKYRLQSSPEKELEVRIIPEGYSWSEPKEDGEVDSFVRFVPYSYHCKLAEDEMLYSRLADLYEKKETLTVEQLKNISESKEKSKTLKYSNHIAAIIKLDESGDILYFRLHDFYLKHRSGTRYAIGLTDSENRVHKMMIDSKDSEYSFENLGKLKLIDLAN